MQLDYAGLADRKAWEGAQVALPGYDPQALARVTRGDPRWVHLGIGNIFRIFIGGIADRLIGEGLLDRGITCVEAFDFDVVDKIYHPHDNLALAVTLHADGSREQRVLGSLSEALSARLGDPSARERLVGIFSHQGLQLVSMTITEKGYALRDPSGEWLPRARADLEGGPGAPEGAMGILTALLWERYLAGAAPLALVSLDNVSENGRKLEESVLAMAGEWLARGFVDRGFLNYLGERISFPWSMIDKITPRPSEAVAASLTAAGIAGMGVVVTSRQTYIAPFVNAEGPQYLVIEDRFPNGRPPLERAGVLMASRDTVRLAERMKVTVCLNPVHTALCTYAVLLGYPLFASAFADPLLRKLAHQLAYVEGLRVVEDPGIISPRAFLDELFTERFPNAYMGDTSARIAVDISQMVGIRFGHTIAAYAQGPGTGSLVAEPLAIAGWIRYLLGVDDQGQPFEISPDPLAGELQAALAAVRWDDPGSLGASLRPILANGRIFGLDLYDAGLGERIEGMVRGMLCGAGAVRATLARELAACKAQP
ncbi:MAG: mannitol dehydrogenase family protein [Succinivibrionaceae bacterium]|nr:mannitol dehydrogenase family protein [Succinivibrionaceae bacterium]